MKIQIQGRSKSGKSTVAALIWAALYEAGFTNVEFEDEDHPDGFDGTELSQRIQAIRGKPVEIEMKQTDRDGVVCTK